MTCNRTIQVQQYHDGELPPDERRALESHLAACAPCRELLADLQGLSSLIRQAPLADMPVHAVARLRNHPACAGDRDLIRVAGWLTAAAAAVLLFALLKAPAGSADRIAAGPSLWETVAVTPLGEVQDDQNGEMVLAQWMADELSSEQMGELR